MRKEQNGSFLVAVFLTVAIGGKAGAQELPGSLLEAQPVSFRIEANFRIIERTVGGSPTAIIDEFAEIHFTVTDPTEILEGPTFTTVGNFAISSAFVTVPALGLSNVPIVDTNLNLFQFDNGSLEQFALHKTTVISPGSWISADLLLSESGSDFIEDPNRPLPLKFDLVGRQLSASSGFVNEFALNLADGSRLELVPPVSNATIANDRSGPTCAIDVSVVDGTLSLDFEIASTEATTWNFWVSVFTKTHRIWSEHLPAVDPAESVSLQIPNFPNLGTIGFLTALVTSKGIVCSDWKVADTGIPSGPGSRRVDLPRLFLEHRR